MSDHPFQIGCDCDYCAAQILKRDPTAVDPAVDERATIPACVLNEAIRLVQSYMDPEVAETFSLTWFEVREATVDEATDAGMAQNSPEWERLYFIGTNCVEVIGGSEHDDFQLIARDGRVVYAVSDGVVREPADYYSREDD